MVETQMTCQEVGLTKKEKGLLAYLLDEEQGKRQIAPSAPSQARYA
ncbi:hypothetical protein [Brevibacillus choshinensis]|nr:hypothetical protein [Brevibacillus choshinensis]